MHFWKLIKDKGIKDRNLAQISPYGVSE